MTGSGIECLQMDIEVLSDDPDEAYAERAKFEDRYHALAAQAQGLLASSESGDGGSVAGSVNKYSAPQSLEGSQAVFKINGSCSTPAGKPGRCISIYSCSQISNKLENPPISEETIALVKSSICKSPVERSVCCETSIGEERVDGSCQAEMTAYPPDPSSACCGEDTVPVNKLTSVGGLPTPIDAHPWAVIIEYIRVKNKQTGLYCGGALISGKYVLTAAHCIAGPFMEIATPKVVRLGEYDLTQEGQDCVLSEFGGDPMDCTDGALRITIEKTIPHPEYTPKISKKNDIGLIRLQETAPYTDFIRPICLPTKDLTQPENIPVNFTMFAVGWGATKTRFQSTIKLQVEVPFVSQEKCQPAYNTSGRRATLGRGQLCAGGKKDVDTCRGDSGGPLVYENWNWTEHTGLVKRSQLIGIVSFGPNPCGEKDVPGIYTNVYEYLDWIRSVIVS